ncbi:GrlR family regulatory protein [Paraburkholderia sp. BL21I4N1]|uniref:GrlR family regulatory protein n=1 Tax=Paraburkholderia sp. BL21I4N1 TaxID=1938801 RepID=UPI000CFC3BC0|nr:GrlR family regulatory protein [Paraburkholderia sp. BL21I4N1]PQV51795.1 type III secretion system (T3SS) negative regulator GrlR [Paraburkholderia sp. BL21I4N1]
MAADGFYSVDFSALTKGARGVVILEDGRIHGGDDQYLYSGQVSGPDDRLEVMLMVKAYVQGAISAFGSHGGKFALSLTGNVIGKDMQFSGPSPVPGSPGITVRATYLSDLDLS